MSAYHHMGHDTENLIGENDLEEFTGIILSPVNRSPENLRDHISVFREKGDYDIVLDPQLYFPRSERGFLREYSYFPSDFDTADTTSSPWWNNTMKLLTDFAINLNVSTVVSPVVQPKIWNTGYYSLCGSISQTLFESFQNSDIRVLSTIMANVSELTDTNKVMEIASIISDTDSDGFYIIFVSDIEPRREFSDETELFGMMCLIKELENTRRPVLVGHCSSEMLLFKAAGASACSTGKFFNLRRFTKSRYEEPAIGGGQLPYWFEHSLLAFLREADILRLLSENLQNLVSTHHSNNHWSKEILSHFESKPEKAWLALSWRQYLSWFGKIELELSTSDHIAIVQKWLKEAEENWRILDDIDLLFDEQRNDGKWLRSWRQALVKFKKAYPQSSTV